METFIYSITANAPGYDTALYRASHTWARLLENKLANIRKPRRAMDYRRCCA